MNRLISLVLILLCTLGLYGCSFDGATQESTGSHIETTLPATQTEQPSASVPTVPAESTTLFF